MLGPDYFHEAPWYQDLRQCTRCSCRAEAQQVIPGTGPLAATLLFIGQNPGGDEDTDGRPFVGRSGIELETWFALLGLTRAQVGLTNAVKCHTKDDRAPKTGELKTCTETWLTQEIAAMPNLRIVLPLGKPALKALIGKEADQFPTMGFASAEVEIGERRLVIAPLPHPAYLLRRGDLRPVFLGQVIPAVKDLIGRVGSKT